MHISKEGGVEGARSEPVILAGPVHRGCDLLQLLKLLSVAFLRACLFRRIFAPKTSLTNSVIVYTVHTHMFVISQADKRPMYLQIMEQMKQQIAVGEWAAGQAIPPIRQLAADIGVSVITVKRAYLELEREGVIVTRQGKGCFITSDSEVGARIREQELAQHLEQAVRSAAMMGLSLNNLEKRIRAIYDRVTDDEKEPA